jgi:hypothetical protein
LWVLDILIVALNTVILVYLFWFFVKEDLAVGKGEKSVIGEK